jgi:hypothetical protein
MMLEKDGDQMDRSYEKRRSVTLSQEGKEYSTYSKKKEGEMDWSHLA